MTDERQATAAALRELSAWVANTDTAKIPDAVLARGAQVLADDLAVIIGARAEPQVTRFHERVLQRAASPEATVFRGGRGRTDRLSAAVANGVAADWLELDEGYRITSCHAGLYVVPALLAEAEATNLPLAAMLRALVLGYEVATRLARAWVDPTGAQHSHARYSAPGAAAAIGAARRLTGDEMLAALGNAVTLVCAGPRKHLVDGALVRNVWPAVGAWSGMMSVEWAQCGIGGIAESAYDAYSTLLGYQVDPAVLTHGLGESWAVLDGYTKLYACCQHLHSTVEAALELRSAILERGGLDRVDAIEVETHDFAMKLVNPSPDTILAGKFSLPHAVATTLVTATAGADAFATAQLDQPVIAALRQRVRMAPYQPPQAPPNDRPSRITVRFVDGKRVTGECLSARGGSDRPFGRPELLAKLAELTAGIYPAAPAVLESLIDLAPRRKHQGWADIVGDICGAATARAAAE
ncbi:MAG: MmgE/PrpD family protein [Alphaproteobacteria bacterium]|nr:MmgE/PrpD family protein [Alphaproteobacteria bacterium]